MDLHLLFVFLVMNNFGNQFGIMNEPVELNVNYCPKLKVTGERHQ